MSSLVEVRQAMYIGGNKPSKRVKNRANEEALLNLVMGYLTRPPIEFLKWIHFDSVWIDSMESIDYTNTKLSNFYQIDLIYFLIHYTFYITNPNSNLWLKFQFFFCQFQPRSSLSVPYFLGLEISVRRTADIFQEKLVRKS